MKFGSSRLPFHLLLVAALLLPAARCPAGEPPWAFAVLADPKPIGESADEKGIQKSFGKDLMYLKEAFIDKADANRPAPSFLLLPGDFSPADVTDRTFARVLGEDFPWLPVLGNHDLSSRDYMAKVMARYEKKMGIRRNPAKGAEDQYQFTFRNAAFVIMDEYDHPKETASASAEANSPAERLPKRFRWIDQSLREANAPFKIVSGHQPAWPFHGHTDDPLRSTQDERDRFWRMLADDGCQLFLCGHTHVYSTYQWLGNGDADRWLGHSSKIIPGPLGVWQLDAGRSAGPDHSDDRVLVYCKVTERCIEVETHVSRKSGGVFGPWQVPADSLHACHRFKIYPEVKSNLPGAAAAGEKAHAAAPPTPGR